MARPRQASPAHRPRQQPEGLEATQGKNSFNALHTAPCCGFFCFGHLFWILNMFHEERVLSLKYDILQVDGTQCDQKKVAKVYKSCPKLISLEKMKDFSSFTKMA